MCVVLKGYTVFYNVDIVENILNLAVIREHLDVLPTALYSTWSTIGICAAQHSTHLGIAEGQRCVGVDGSSNNRPGSSVAERPA